MYIFSAILITFPLPPLPKGLCLSAKIVAFYSGADNGSSVAFHLCTFGALFLHFYFTINILMSEEKEMTAPNVSIGVDTEQSSIKQTTNSISNRDVNFNPFDEFFKKIDSSYMKTVTMQELYQDIYSKKPPVIEGLLYQGTYLFVGSPKIGKSFFMAQLAYHVSTGTPLWDYPVKKGTVLYLALEDDYRRLQERMYRMFGTETTPNLFFSVASKSLNERLLD